MCHGELIYHAVIKVEPKSKKNGMVIRYKKKNGVDVPFIAQGDIYKQYELNSGWFLRKLKKPIEEKVNCKYIFYRASKHRIDITNMMGAVDDILVHYGILKDDCFSIVAGHDGSRVYIDKENPRTEIFIERWNEDDT